MKKFLNNLQSEATKIRMTSAEKSAMRAAIFGAPSPVAPVKTPYVFFSFFSSTEFRMAMAGVFMVLLVGSGTASAAAGSLPGDLLYPVKISLTEKVEAALAPSTAAKAAVEVALAERRVEEAQTLASEGRLDAAVAEKLAVAFETHADSATELADKIEAKEPGAAAQIKTKLSSSLAVNGAVLKRLGKGSKDARTKEESQTLGTRVIARAEGPAKVAMQARAFAAAPAPKAATTMMMAAENADASMETMVTERAAAELQKKAAENLADAKELFNDLSAQLDATTTAQVREQFATADEEMSRGSALLPTAFGEAQAHFAAAFSISVRLEALLKAEKRFDSGILRGLLNDDNSGEGSSNGEDELKVLQ